MKKNIESEESDLLIVLKKALRTETSEDFRRICEKAIDIIEKKRTERYLNLN